MNSVEETRFQRQGMAKREVTKGPQGESEKNRYCRWTQKRISLRLAAAMTSYEKQFLHMNFLLSTPVAESATG